MNEKIIEIKEQKDLAEVISFVCDNFKQSEKNFYAPKDLMVAEKHLKQFDVFQKNELFRMIEIKRVRVVALVHKNKLIAVGGLDIKQGRLLFLSAKQDNQSLNNLKEILDILISFRDDEPDGRLQILAFLGISEQFRKLGFIKLQNTIYNFGIKLVPMQYNYAQLDVEK